MDDSHLREERDRAIRLLYTMQQQERAEELLKDLEDRVVVRIERRLGLDQPPLVGPPVPHASERYASDTPAQRKRRRTERQRRNKAERQRRRAGEEETMKTWWLSFAADDGFLGALIVDAVDPMDAIRTAWLRDLNPGGEVMMVELPSAAERNERERDVFDAFSGRLLTREECRLFDAAASAARNGGAA